MPFTELDKKMKLQEAAWEQRLPADQPFVMRLDGHGFSKFTRGFDKPFDERIHQAMVLTTGELMKTFNAMAGYTQSDEITLAFPAAPELTETQLEKGSKRTLQFDGRVQKMTSLAAGLCSVKFNQHLQAQPLREGDSERVMTKLTGFQAFFDARVFSMTDNGAVMENVLWRKSDCVRNSVSMLAQSVFSHKVLQGKGVKSMLRMLEEESDRMGQPQLAWATCPLWFRYGTVVKRAAFQKECVDRKTGETVLATRNRLVAKSWNFVSSPAFSGTLFTKAWPEDGDSCCKQGDMLTRVVDVHL